MADTLVHLQQMVENLQALNATLAQEQQLLCAGQVDAVRLQTVTLEKENLLADLRHLDQRRRDDAAQPPYAEPQQAALWQTILTLTRQLHDMNQHNGDLLNRHLSHNQQALGTLKSRHGQTLYGPDGQTQSGLFNARKLRV
ncbi:flagellar export chaperone FlgN [Edwardsiella piscicida]|uniref:Flagellar biosynthesis protein FlgN n=3 Tax=Edwardsiella TaxID=635 RepID=A0A0H3DPL0_EDWTF|nr:flagellar export chaperone FlgN [Edwardsiella piscicida]ACY84065.1 flagella synthesis protein [Edwardsiella tarda EIB202]ADM41249.1 Flagellar biosynthesis protein FlgN [Edwardsiella tarda FL6-60]AGH73287.1 Flagellar biosynthesis protein FlgN [Edwardsiella piscicida C07-087]AOP42610.1 flagellar export chaperone FlgN [Edwardsiella piscicida]ARD17197.1 flagella synthesis protein [Edwardsiella piscicida]